MTIDIEGIRWGLADHGDRIAPQLKAALHSLVDRVEELERENATLRANASKSVFKRLKAQGAIK